MKFMRFGCICIVAIYCVACDLSTNKREAFYPKKMVDAVKVKNLSLQTSEDLPVSFSLKDDELSDVIVDIKAPMSGKVEGCDKDQCTYIPNENFHGTDEFNYDLRLEQKVIATGVIKVTVSSVNDSPSFVEIAKSVSVKGGETIQISFPEAYDVDNENLEYSFVQPPSFGKFIDCSGEINQLKCTYLAPIEGSSWDEFVYSVTDGEVIVENKVVIQIEKTRDSDGDFLPDVLESTLAEDKNVSNLPRLTIKPQKTQMSISINKEIISLERINDMKKPYTGLQNQLMVMSHNQIVSEKFIKYYDDEIDFDGFVFLGVSSFKDEINYQNLVKDKLAKGQQIDEESGVVTSAFSLSDLKISQGDRAKDLLLGLYYIKDKKAHRLSKATAMSEGVSLKLALQDGKCSNCSGLVDVRFDGINPFFLHKIIQEKYPLFIRLDDMNISSDTQNISLKQIVDSVSQETIRLIVSSEDKLIDQRIVNDENLTLLELFKKIVKEVNFSEDDMRLFSVDGKKNELSSNVHPLFLEHNQRDLFTWLYLTNSGVSLNAVPIKGKTYALVYAKAGDIADVFSDRILLAPVTLSSLENQIVEKKIISLRPNDIVEMRVWGETQTPTVSESKQSFNTWHFKTISTCVTCQTYRWRDIAPSGYGQCEKASITSESGTCARATVQLAHTSHVCPPLCINMSYSQRKVNRGCTAKYQSRVFVKSDLIENDQLDGSRFKIFIAGKEVNKANYQLIHKGENGNELFLRLSLSDKISSEGYDKLVVKLLPDPAIKKLKVGLMSSNCNETFTDMPNDRLLDESFNKEFTVNFDVKIFGIPR